MRNDASWAQGFLVEDIFTISWVTETMSLQEKGPEAQTSYYICETHKARGPPKAWMAPHLYALSRHPSCGLDCNCCHPRQYPSDAL